MVSQIRQARCNSGHGVIGLFLLFCTLVACDHSGQAEQFARVANAPGVYGAANGSIHLDAEPIRALSSLVLPEPDPQMVSLGRSLFHDTRLSGDGSQSCASCHDIAAGGDDGRSSSIGIGGQIGEVNAPTVLNSAFNFRQFWDGRSDSLESQALDPVSNPLEMGASWSDVLESLAGDDAFMQRFESAFGDRQLKVERVGQAIAAYERTLITPSAFDDYLDGNEHAISRQAIEGYGLFKNLGCIACHQGVNVGGNLMQYFGAFLSVDVALARLDTANTREDETEDQGQASHIPLYKVPSLRNVALTAPYMHDGSVRHLRDAVRLMGVVQLGYRLDDDEVSLIVAFLESLGGRLPADEVAFATGSE